MCLIRLGERPGSAFQGIAQRFVNARQDGRPLDGFPGRLPETLAEAYECQEAAIGLWRDAIGGWKVGLIGSALAGTFGIDRLAGPIFKRSIQRCAPGSQPEFPIIAGGFAAVEAELVLVVAHDAPRDKMDWTLEDAAAMVAAVHIGVEIAGSPLEDDQRFGAARNRRRLRQQRGSDRRTRAARLADARTRRLALRDLHRRREPRTGARRRGARAVRSSRCASCWL